MNRDVELTFEQRNWAFTEICNRVIDLATSNFRRLVDGVIAVPSNSQHEFELALTLADRISEAINLPNCSKAIHKTRTVPSVKNQTKSLRRESLAGLYSCEPLKDVRRVLIVDDVATTFSTVGELASSIRKANKNTSVSAFILSRTADFVGNHE